MRVVYRRCCGIDVHKKEIVACLITGQKKRELRTFGTTTQELRVMVEWLKISKCEMVAMESTGSYWKPLYNVFEMEELPAMLVNAAHMKAIPGRKTDQKDAEWIADLLRHGLLKGSFIPDRSQREYRELTRYRSSRVAERAREINRLQKFLEGANIKLAGYLTDMTGKSATRLLELLTNEGEITDEQVRSACEKNIKASI